MDYVIENKNSKIYSDIYDILFEISTLGDKYMPYNISRFKVTLPSIQYQFITGLNYEIDLTQPINSIKNEFVDYYIKMVNSEYNKICKPVKQNADNNIKKIDNFTKNNKSRDNTETDKCTKILNILKDFFKENNNYIDKFVTKDFTSNTLFNNTWRNQIKESNIE